MKNFVSDIEAMGTATLTAGADLQRVDMYHIKRT